MVVIGFFSIACAKLLKVVAFDHVNFAMLLISGTVVTEMEYHYIDSNGDTV